MEKIKVLLVDDEQDLLDATKLFLEIMEPKFNIDLALTVQEALTKINQEPYDVIISDYQMPDLDGLEFLTIIREREQDTPFIIFTGRGREEVAIRALNLGADYYLQKGGDPKSQFRELVNLIEKSIDRRETKTALMKSEEKFSKAFQYGLNANAIIRIRDLIFLDINENFSKLLDYSREEIVNKPLDSLKLLVNPKEIDTYKELLLKKNEIVDYETLLVSKNSRIIPVQISSSLIEIEEELCALAIIRDISALSEAQEELKENEMRYRFLFEEFPIALINLNLFNFKKQLDEINIKDKEELMKYLELNPEIKLALFSKIKIVEVNKIALKMFDIPEKDYIDSLLNYELINKHNQIFFTMFSHLISGEKITQDEFTYLTKNNEQKSIIIKLSIAPGSSETWSKVFVTLVDITERVIAEENMKKERLALKIIADSAVASKDITDMCDKVLQGLLDVLQFDFGTIRIYDKEEESLKPISIIGLTNSQKEYVKTILVESDKHILASRLKEKVMIFLPDIIKTELYENNEFFQQLKIRSYIFCPLIGHSGNTLGSLQIGSREVKIFEEKYRIFFKTIAEMISTILERMINRNNNNQKSIFQ
ncbi:MAG TPA: response regulator [candidate division Zixibacteria bacterium]|nr:response regulator [candidate division Zixibacteria bacterium]